MSRRKQYQLSKGAIQTRPKSFPVVIKAHAYDESGLGTCLHCSQDKNFRLHIRTHFYERNMNSSLARCICGLNEEHQLHMKGQIA